MKIFTDKCPNFRWRDYQFIIIGAFSKYYVTYVQCILYIDVQIGELYKKVRLLPLAAYPHLVRNHVQLLLHKTMETRSHFLVTQGALQWGAGTGCLIKVLI